MHDATQNWQVLKYSNSAHCVLFIENNHKYMMCSIHREEESLPMRVNEVW